MPGKRDEHENRTVVFGAVTLPPQPPPVAATPPVAVPLAERPVPSARYEYVDLIGVGGMGEVHRVRDRDLGRVLAM